jgi:uncharacterized protein YllA (UPF0747 family)
LYERLLGHMPRLVSRTGFTLVDSRSAKLLERYTLHLHDLFHGEEPLRERIASTLVPSGLQEHFDEAAAVTTQTLDRLQRSVASFDPTIAAAVEKSRSKMLYQLSKSRNKVARAILRRDERALSEASWLYSTLYPHKHLQERLYGILPFLAQHGPDLVDRLYSHVHMDCPDHILLPL